MTDMKKDSLELRIRGVSMEDDEPIVILEDRSMGSRLQVRVGPFEASAIIVELEGIAVPRPLTHDLLAQVFEEGGFSLDEVELFGESQDDSRARALLSQGPAQVREGSAALRRPGPRPEAAGSHLRRAEFAGEEG